MKIKLFSDIHIEFGNAHMIDDLFSNINVDAFIVPGDLANQEMIVKVLHEIDKMVQVPVIFVPGNHEYYGSQKSYVDHLLKNEKFDHIKILIEDVFEYKDIVFLGSTGWWDNITLYHTNALNDFRVIYDIISNDNGMAWGRCSKDFFKTNLEKYQDRKVVCVSHNMPSHKCIHPIYSTSKINECFANHWDNLIIDNKPLYWFCGHTHDSINMVIDKTNIICNPYGYYLRQTNTDWKDNFIINITD